MGVDRVHGERGKQLVDGEVGVGFAAFSGQPRIPGSDTVVGALIGRGHERHQSYVADGVEDISVDHVMIVERFTHRENVRPLHRRHPIRFRQGVAHSFVAGPEVDPVSGQWSVEYRPKP
ncbi:hypothetical protein [Nocardia carnea]|uniref:hypothetical protein n=1 Tax=Nocardia carnea TaxID=37328 RepID=UPI0024587F30|nr:hypothetical protein [Nocardia carnea]